MERLVSRSLMRRMFLDGRKAFLKRVDLMVEDLIYNVLWGGVDVGMPLPPALDLENATKCSCCYNATTTSIGFRMLVKI